MSYNPILSGVPATEPNYINEGKDTKNMDTIPLETEKKPTEVGTPPPKKAEKPKKDLNPFYLDDNERLNLDGYVLRAYFQEKGFKCINTAGDENVPGTLVHVKDNIVTLVSPLIFRRILINEAARRKYNIGQANRLAFNYFNNGLTDTLFPLETLPFMRDNEDVAWLYFKNYAVKVTEYGTMTFAYKDLKAHVWHSQILNYDYKEIAASWRSSLVAKFISYAFTKKSLDEHLPADAEHFNKVCTVLGYMLHDYKSRKTVKAVIALDGVNEEGSNGRSGKSLIADIFAKVRNVVTIDGRPFTTFERFPLDRVERETKIINFNDINDKFPLDWLFGMLTNDMEIRKKGMQTENYTFEESPKFYLSTNFVPELKDSSTRARFLLLEVSDFFNVDNTPFKTLGKMLFDWESDNPQWNYFHLFISYCLQTYLALGLQQPPLSVYSKRLQAAQHNESFWEFMGEQNIKGQTLVKKDLVEGYADYIKTFGGKPLDGKKFTLNLKAYCAQNGITINGKDPIDFTPADKDGKTVDKKVSNITDGSGKRLTVEYYEFA